MLAASLASSQEMPPTATDLPRGDGASSQKELYLPGKVWKVPPGNDYTNQGSEYSFRRMAQSENIAAFWAKELGDTPSQNPEVALRFNLEEALQECERFYDFYVNKLKFVQKGNSVTDKYKILFYIFGGKDGTAYGGGEEKKVGILWTPPSRMAKAPYGALAHELGHAFQYLVHADGAWGFSSAPKGSGQPIFEMTSQYMLWQVYPEWITFENYHLKGFMEKTHYAFLHETNQYHSPFVLEYWSQKHGIEFIGKLWREALEGEDPVMAYQRLTSTNQQKFNDEIFDAARRFITWDLARIENVSSKYANQHISSLKAVGNGWYQVAEKKCPQNYGYNGIKLQVPAAGTKVSLEFKGVAGAEGFRAIRTQNAGWRYGFLAVKEDGSREYGKVYSSNSGTGSFRVPEKTQHLWLVVSGAPTEHWEHLADGKEENDEQWPYQVRLRGTSLDDSVLE